MKLTFETLIDTLATKHLCCSGCHAPQPEAERQEPEIETHPDGGKTVWVKTYLCPSCRVRRDRETKEEGGDPGEVAALEEGDPGI